MPVDQAVPVDVLIVGGGIAGLWTLAKLRRAGYRAVLIESEALGHGQTRFAQGIIHGGTKYALTGKLTASTEALADMPATWRACHAGEGEIDLRAAVLLSDAHYLWSTTSLASRLSGFFASKVMRSRTAEVEDTSRPALFDRPDFRGQVYRLDEPVFDSSSLVRSIATPLLSSILAVRRESIEPGVNTLAVEDRQGNSYKFSYNKLVLMAGQGNAGLIARLGQTEPRMQLRPLKMVMVRGGLPGMIYAHCLGASVNPRVTITSHRDLHENIVWYIGGQLAEVGVRRDNDAQIDRAKVEIADLFPWLDLSASQWTTLDIDRAEVRKADGSRPATFYTEEHGDIITAWPTKLALAPLLAADVLERVNAADISISTGDLPVWPVAAFAEAPWREESRWLLQ
jgi:glycine/D-amino acid oxidase-like deaminating enzyme